MFVCCFASWLPHTHTYTEAVRKASQEKDKWDSHLCEKGKRCTKLCCLGGLIEAEGHPDPAPLAGAGFY